MCWLLIPSLLLATLFSGMEHALVASSKLRIEVGNRQGKLSARIQYQFLQNMLKFRLTISMGYLLSVFLFEALFLHCIFLHLISDQTGFVIWLILGVLGSTLPMILIADFFARTFCVSYAENFLSFFSVPAYLCYLIFLPVTSVTQYFIHLFFNNASKERINEIYGIKPVDGWPVEMESGGYGEDIDEQELRIFRNAVGFSKVRVRDCMVTRTEVEAIDIRLGVNELWNKFVETGYSKLIVYSESIDNVVGYISSKDLFKKPASIEEKINIISFIPETMPANRLLNEFMQYHRSIALVVDEYGGTSGIVTLEDVIEEIFGEIEDEYDTTNEIERKVRPHEFVLSCRLRIDYLNSKYDFHIPENENFDTLAGFILYYYHNLPKSNDVIEIERFVFKILKVSKNRIELVYLKFIQK